MVMVHTKTSYIVIDKFIQPTIRVRCAHGFLLFS